MHESPKYDTDTKWANAVGKLTQIDLPDAELPQTFSLLKHAVPVKHNKTMCTKMRYAYIFKA